MLISRPRHQCFGALFLAVNLLAAGESAANPSASSPQPSAEIVASSESGWPQFRGPKRDGVSNERGLLQSWPEAGPKLLWSASGIGRGYSSPIVTAGRIFLTGDADDALRIHAFDLKGKKLWQSANGAPWTGDYPGARASAAYSKGKLYHQNAHGRIACLDAGTGRELWSVDLQQQFGGKNITWARSECLLVSDGAVYATAGGSDALMVALNSETGAVLWKTEALQDPEDGKPEPPSYASPVLANFAGRRLILGVSLRHLFCVDADTGKLQFSHRMPTTYSVIAMMPAVIGDSVFMTAPHGRRGKLLRLIAPKDAQSPVGVEEVWTTRLDTCQGSTVHWNGKIIGSFYGPRQGWAAVDVKSGEVLHQAPELIKGSAILADDRLYTLSENGWMHLLAPGDTEFGRHGRFRLAEAKNDAWAHPVIHDGRLYLRYHDTLFCYDIRQSTSAE